MRTMTVALRRGLRSAPQLDTRRSGWLLTAGIIGSYVHVSEEDSCFAIVHLKWFLAHNINDLVPKTQDLRACRIVKRLRICPWPCHLLFEKLVQIVSAEAARVEGVVALSKAVVFMPTGLGQQIVPGNESRVAALML